MSWFKVDDGFHCHPKAMAAGTAALGLWVRCGSYAAQHLTEGFIPKGIADMYGTKAMVSALVKAGLWTPSENGFQMHDWLDRNPTRDEVQAQRDAAAERQRRARERARESRRDASVSHAPVTELGVTVPPTRPDPTQENQMPEAPPRTDVEGLCRYFAEAISRNGVKATITEKWRTEARLLLDKDKRDRNEIRQVIDWCTQDPFWKANVHSVPTLRAKYDRLRLAMQREQPGASSANPHMEHLEQWR